MSSYTEHRIYSYMPVPLGGIGILNLYNYRHLEMFCRCWSLATVVFNKVTNNFQSKDF